MQFATNTGQCMVYLLCSTGTNHICNYTCKYTFENWFGFNWSVSFKCSWCLILFVFQKQTFCKIKNKSKNSFILRWVIFLNWQLRKLSTTLDAEDVNYAEQPENQTPIRPSIHYLYSLFLDTAVSPVVRLLDIQYVHSNCVRGTGAH